MNKVAMSGSPDYAKRIARGRRQTLRETLAIATATLAAAGAGVAGLWITSSATIRDNYNHYLKGVAISAAHHFRVSLIPLRHTRSRVLAAANTRLGRVVPYCTKRSRMVKAVLYGDASTSRWLQIPWRDHYDGFRHSSALVLKYEDLLERPLAKCHELLEYLGAPKPERHVAEAIAKQSFGPKKAALAAEGKPDEAAFLRRGSHGYWRTELDREEKRLFVEEVGDELGALGYPLE